MTLIWMLTAAYAQPMVAIVVVDQEARESGYALEIDGFVVDEALPLDVAEGERLQIIEPDGRAEPLHVAPGEAWEVVGPDGEAWMSELDNEVRTDVLLVRGEAESIAALAETLDAELIVDGDRTWLAGKDVLLDAPWVDNADGLQLDEVTLVRVDDEAPVRLTTPAGAADKPIRRRAKAQPAIASRSAAAGSEAKPESSDSADRSSSPDGSPDDEAVEAALRESSLDFGADHAVRGNYAGLHLCADDMLWLHPAGVYSLRGVTGTWSVGAPGVVRMHTDMGEVLFRAAIDPQTGFCRDVWTPEQTGHAMPEGYERFTSKRRRKK